jgi:hypothetical protein
MMVMELNEDNLKLVTEVIQRHLTTDLIPRKWATKNADNPTFGHCHTVAGCLYKVFGSENLNMYRGFDGEIYHWWVQDKQGRIIDLTADQYLSKNRVPPYHVGEKAGILGFEYKNRVKKLYNRVMTELENKKEGIFNYYE